MVNTECQYGAMIEPYKVESWFYALKITNQELYGLYVIAIMCYISSKTQKYAHIIGQMYKD